MHSAPEEVGWLFLDLNSYFASVEQQERPELRGKPVAVVPIAAETTCCIAASYEAKTFGVKTGVGVKDAKRMCPGIILVKARQELYAQYHYRIREAVDTCVPVSSVLSVDEMACRLLGRERHLSMALHLAKKIKEAIRQMVGETLCCSIGLAPNRLLAKTASDIEKPDGLYVIRQSDLPEVLYSLGPADLPGIGPRMDQRLRQHGVFTIEQLFALSPAEMRSIWGSVVGERFWHWIRGVDFEEITASDRSIGHEHVLPPELRTVGQAGAVGQRLLHKAAARLRRMQMWAGGLSLHVSYSPGREKKVWECHARISECHDTVTLVEFFRRMWKSCPEGKPALVGVTLYDLAPARQHTISIFPEEQQRARLARAMDSLNEKFGANTVYLGGIHHVRDSAPVCSAFGRVPALKDF